MKTLLAIVVLFLMPSSSWANNCTEGSIKFDLEHAYEVFMGEVSLITVLGVSESGDRLNQVRFKATDLWKGPENSDKVVHAVWNPKQGISYRGVFGSTGLVFEVGKIYLVFVRKKSIDTPEGKGVMLHTGVCFGSREIREDQENIGAVLGPLGPAKKL